MEFIVWTVAGGIGALALLAIGRAIDCCVDA